MRFIATLTLLILLGGCGQTGPLYLPTATPEPPTAGDSGEASTPEGS